MSTPVRLQSPRVGSTRPSPFATDSAAWPDYCCAILHDAQNRLLIERRPVQAADAPGQLACFGGKRDATEHPDRCIRREIKEELGWSVGALRLLVSVRLRERASGRDIAWFYMGRGPREGLTLKPLPGSTALWMTPEEVFASPDLSAWHRAALDAHFKGDMVAWIDE